MVSGQFTAEEVEHQPGDFWSVAFQGEVACVEQVHFRFGEVFWERVGPHCQQGRLVLAKGPINDPKPIHCCFGCNNLGQVGVVFQALDQQIDEGPHFGRNPLAFLV